MKSKMRGGVWMGRGPWKEVEWSHCIRVAPAVDGEVGREEGAQRVYSY